MANFRGSAVLSTFNVPEEEADFLSDIIDSSLAPANEVQSLVEASIFANSDDFHHLVSCATAIQRSKFRDPNSLEGNDVLTFIWRILNGRECASDAQPAPWAETDRLIAIAKDLADHPPHICSPRFDSGQAGGIAVRRRRRRRRCRTIVNNSKSPYWSEEKDSSEEQVRNDNDTAVDSLGHRPQRGEYAGRFGSDLSLEITCPFLRPRRPITRTAESVEPAESVFDGELSHSSYTPSSHAKLANTRLQLPSSSPFLVPAINSSEKRLPSSSPYFVPAISSSEKKPRKRKLGGIVSSVPFPPLFCSRFGLIQEEMAHEPFWLLIAVTFLIKTNGRVAIPVFHKVKERFPSPKQLAEPSNADELLGMIRHLGLAKHRLRLIQKYATLFLEAPPMAGTLHKVRNYGQRDCPSGFEDMCSIGIQNQSLDTLLIAYSGVGKASMEAWEIGHMTQGKYTLDSWRIFCRDKLLGRAEDWNGKGREPEFQPEWMRVMPQDKELRAFLRWMWMREGWEWDPVTGERRVLRPELQLAVNEYRVEYDDEGGLRILDFPQQTIDA
ncbi:hypothetical protein E4U54_006601 [Claviceps lovelessii]|nr:hypothetical protein E4U54_006601 [Claviceps lovelessii]